MRFSVAALALVAPASALIRFPCSQLVTERLDPLVNPGEMATPHLHQIVGGNSFNATMSPDQDPAAKSTCTTCQFSEDFSNYWTAVMYFKARNGTFKRVQQIPNVGFDGQTGGMTVYYMQDDVYKTSSFPKVTAFKKGFRMLVGNAANQDKKQANYFRGVGFTCLATSSTRDVVTVDFPAAPCAAGIMSIVKFPTCWNGKDLDTPNHMDHMAYPVSGTFETQGPCPDTHPVRMPQLFYEVIWNTKPFNNKADWPADGSQPFVWSFGDTKGYGSHGDYIFGWKNDALQKIMDEKCYINCKSSPSQNIATQNKCTVASVVKEETDGWLPHLPGNPPMMSKN